MVAENVSHSNFLADSLLETSWSQRTRRGWTTLTSFGVELIVIGLLLLLPLWKTIGLPGARVVSTPVTVGLRPAEPQQRSAPAHAARPSNPTNSVTIARFVEPGHIPTRIVTTDDTPAPAADVGNGLDRIGDSVAGDPTLPIASGNYHPVVPAAPPHTVRPLPRTSSMLEGNLTHRVQPVYPSTAKMARIQGVVVLAAIISRAGTIENLQVMSGHPLLTAAAIEAVRQWRYKPYILNGEPIEVATQITVNFTLSQ